MKKINRCLCGSQPLLERKRKTCGHGEFPLFVWVECPCGLRGKEFIVDGFYGSTDTCDDAIDFWNSLISSK